MEPGTGDEHAQCRFPGRYAWLKSRLDFDAPEVACPALKSWKDLLNPESATVVFASAYLNSPASMYGHTFLRIERKARGDDQRLLDQTLNYAAYAPDSNPLVYAVRGLAGGYPGRYSMLPYYIKVQEYTNLESRDLWEYRLSLSSAQIDRLLDHAWEVGSIHFPYFFFNKNCSYQLLPIIDAADPQLSLTPPWRPSIVPSDTLRWIQSSSAAAGDVRFRPSRLKIVRRRRAPLDQDERAIAAALASGSVDEGLSRAQALDSRRRALVFDAASDYILYRVGPNPEPGGDVLERERKLLTARAALSHPPLPIERADEDVAPHQGHGTARLIPAWGATKDSSFAELSWRAALHDLIDPSASYEPGSQLEMANVVLRYDQQARRLYLQKLVALDILSVTPWDPWVRQQSWKVSTGLETADELGQAPWSSLYYRLRAGRGLALDASVAQRRGILYGFLEADTGAGAVFRDRYRAGGGVSAGWIAEVTRRWRAGFEVFYLRYVGDSRANEGIRLTQQADLSSGIGLRLGLERRAGRGEISAALVAYY